MRRFAYERPGTLAEVTHLLAEAGGEARLLAGGTDLVVGLRDGSIEPAVVIDLKWVEEFSGPTIVPGSVAAPTRRLVTASRRRRWNVGSSYTSATTIPRLAAEHF